MTFDLNKPVRTRDGREARIICTDVKKTTGGSILALITNENGKEYPDFYHNDGKYHEGEETRYDLVNIPERVERWANVYGPHHTMVAYQYEDRKTADRHGTVRNGLIKLVYEGDKLVEVSLEKE